MLSTQLKSLTDLRSDPLTITQLAKDEGPIYILNRNKPVGVILDVSEYEEIMDRLQDALDIVEIKQKKKKAKSSDFIDHKELFEALSSK